MWKKKLAWWIEVTSAMTHVLYAVQLNNFDDNDGFRHD